MANLFGYSANVALTEAETKEMNQYIKLNKDLSDVDGINMSDSWMVFSSTFRNYYGFDRFYELSSMFPATLFKCEITPEEGKSEISFISNGEEFETKQQAFDCLIDSIKSNAKKYLKNNDNNGFLHNVLLNENGRVTAEGENFCGQCDVEKYENIIEVSTGEFHTVLLDDQGRVFGCGSNANKEIDFLNINKKVKHISCGRYHTALLCDDGTVEIVGEIPSIYDSKVFNERLKDCGKGPSALPKTDSNLVQTPINLWKDIVEIISVYDSVLAFDKSGKAYLYGNCGLTKKELETELGKEIVFEKASVEEDEEKSSTVDISTLNSAILWSGKTDYCRRVIDRNCPKNGVIYEENSFSIVFENSTIKKNGRKSKYDFEPIENVESYTIETYFGCYIIAKLKDNSLRAVIFKSSNYKKWAEFIYNFFNGQKDVKSYGDGGRDSFCAYIEKTDGTFMFSDKKDQKNYDDLVIKLNGKKIINIKYSKWGSIFEDEDHRLYGTKEYGCINKFKGDRSFYKLQNGALVQNIDNSTYGVLHFGEIIIFENSKYIGAYEKSVFSVDFNDNIKINDGLFNAIKPIENYMLLEDSKLKQLSNIQIDSTGDESHDNMVVSLYESGNLYFNSTKVAQNIIYFDGYGLVKVYYSKAKSKGDIFDKSFIEKLNNDEGTNKEIHKGFIGDTDFIE